MNIFGESGIVEWYESDTPAFQKGFVYCVRFMLNTVPRLLKFNDLFGSRSKEEEDNGD